MAAAVLPKDISGPSASSSQSTKTFARIKSTLDFSFRTRSKKEKEKEPSNAPRRVTFEKDSARPSRMAGFTSFITPSLRQASKSSPALHIPPTNHRPSKSVPLASVSTTHLPSIRRKSLDSPANISAVAPQSPKACLKLAISLISQSLSHSSSSIPSPPPHMLKGTQAQREQAQREWQDVHIRLRTLASIKRGTPYCKERRLFHDVLSDGYILCHLINTLRASTLVRPSISSSNITKFLAACASYGLAEEDLFQQDDFTTISEDDSDQDQDDEDTPASQAATRIATTIIKLVAYIDTPAPSRVRWVKGGGEVVERDYDADGLIDAREKERERSTSRSSFSRNGAASPSTPSRRNSTASPTGRRESISGRGRTTPILRTPTPTSAARIPTPTHNTSPSGLPPSSYVPPITGTSAHVPLSLASAAGSSQDKDKSSLHGLASDKHHQKPPSSRTQNKISAGSSKPSPKTQQSYGKTGSYSRASASVPNLSSTSMSPTQTRATSPFASPSSKTAGGGGGRLAPSTPTPPIKGGRRTGPGSAVHSSTPSPSPSSSKAKAAKSTSPSRYTYKETQRLPPMPPTPPAPTSSTPPAVAGAPPVPTSYFDHAQPLSSSSASASTTSTTRSPIKVRRVVDLQQTSGTSVRALSPSPVRSGMSPSVTSLGSTTSVSTSASASVSAHRTSNTIRSTTSNTNNNANTISQAERERTKRLRVLASPDSRALPKVFYDDDDNEQEEEDEDDDDDDDDDDDMTDGEGTLQGHGAGMIIRGRETFRRFNGLNYDDDDEQDEDEEESEVDVSISVSYPNAPSPASHPVPILKTPIKHRREKEALSPPPSSPISAASRSSSSSRPQPRPIQHSSPVPIPSPPNKPTRSPMRAISSKPSLASLSSVQSSSYSGKDSNQFYDQTVDISLSRSAGSVDLNDRWGNRVSTSPVSNSSPNGLGSKHTQMHLLSIGTDRLSPTSVLGRGQMRRVSPTQHQLQLARQRDRERLHPYAAAQAQAEADEYDQEFDNSFSTASTSSAASASERSMRSFHVRGDDSRRPHLGREHGPVLTTHPHPHHPRDRHQNQNHPLNHSHYPPGSSSSASVSRPSPVAGRPSSPLHLLHTQNQANNTYSTGTASDPPSPIQLQPRQSVASTTLSEATTATSAVSSILDGGGGGWGGMRRYGAGDSGHRNSHSGGSAGNGAGAGSNNFGTIRTMTTDMTSDAGSMKMPDEFGVDGSVGGSGSGMSRKRNSFDRERKLSGVPGVDLMRVMEEEGLAEEGGTGREMRGRGMGASSRENLRSNPSSSPVSAVHLRQGRWPDEFNDVFGSNHPNSAPASKSRFASASPSPHRSRHSEVSSPLSSSPLSVSPPRKLAIVGARRSDPLESSSNGLNASGALTSDRALGLSPASPRRPTHRPRHSLDTPTSILLPKESLLRREASPDSSTGSSRVVLRRHSTKAGLVGANGRPASRTGSGTYLPRDSVTPTSDTSDRGSGGRRSALVPFPRSVSGPGAENSGRTPSPRSSMGGDGIGDRPRMVRGRFTSDIESTTTRRKARPNSYDELGVKPRSRFESMVNLGATNGAATASDLMTRERDSMDDSAVRARLVVREDGKPPTHFQLGNCIGRGQFGSVYRALNLNTGQMVAVKRIRLEGLKEDEVTQLMREVDLVKSLSHPSIVKYEGVARDANTLNIILEYAENGSLGQTLKAFGKLNEALVARYVVKILEGLHYLHASDVVHCDLKAANILTTKNGNVKLSDFGVSLNLRAMEREIKDVAGTPNWMAPEVIELKGASTKSDIWSLGCTVVELLTGRPPYADIANSMTVMFRIVEDHMPPLPEGCDEMLNDFLTLCFNKDPTQRPSAEELCEHPWLKKNWSAFKDLRGQDSIPFIRRVSADLQKPDIRYLSQLEIPDSPLSTSPKDRMISPLGRRTSTSSVRPEPDFSPREHSFVKTTFSKPMVCRVCLLNVKKAAVICSQCSLISHSKCANNAPPTCDLRAQLLLYAQYAEKGNPPTAYANPAENSDPHPVAMSDVAFVEHSRTSLDGVQPSPISPEAPPTAFKLIAAFKRSRSNLTSEPAQPGAPTPTPKKEKYKEEERLPKKRSTVSKRSERPMSISSNHTGVSSLRSAATANESFSSRQNTGKRSQFSGSDKSRQRSAGAIAEMPTLSKPIEDQRSDAEERDGEETHVPGSLPVDPRRVKKRAQSSGNCAIQ